MPSSHRTQDLAIVGGGAAGVLVAIATMRQARRPLRIALVERSGRFGCGLAYGTAEPEHLLNVPASGMSAIPEDRAHFARWLSREARLPPHAFAPRSMYGRYLSQVLDAAERCFSHQLERIHDEVVELRPPKTHRPALLTCSSGETIPASSVVLALGNLPPLDPPLKNRRLFESDRYFRDPWSPEAIEGLDRREPVLLIGSGLTSVDVACSLLARGHSGPVHLLSRHGQLPRVHGGRPAPDGALWVPPAGLRMLLRWVRVQVARGGDWQAVIDALRPQVPTLWGALTEQERARFLRHLRTLWDVHRHRMAPEVGRRIDAAMRDGQLRLHAGRLIGARSERDGLDVFFRPRGEAHVDAVRAARVVNCIGPGTDPRRAATPLLRKMLARGHAVADPLGLGLLTDPSGALLDRRRRAQHWLYTLGTLRRGSLWESTAIPEIREQAAALAELLIARDADVIADEGAITARDGSS